jgi:hypothetical protein
MVYDFVQDPTSGRWSMRQDEVVYTSFEASMLRVSTTAAGPMKDFLDTLQTKLDEKLEPTDVERRTISELGEPWRS